MKASDEREQPSSPFTLSSRSDDDDDSAELDASHPVGGASEEAVTTGRGRASGQTGSSTSDEASGMIGVAQVDGSTGEDVAVNAEPIRGEELGSGVGASSLQMMMLAAVTLAVASVVASSVAGSSDVLPEAP
mgnify:CR=1 FL=1